MSEMVEKMARAIAESQGWRLPDQLEPYAEGSLCDLSVQAARAAIKAMMEPTEGMLAATMTATPALVTQETVDDLQMIRRDWQAMLTAALEESKEG